jgi:DUF971 family protein
MTDKFFPQDVTVDIGQQTLTIVWGDGHQSVYPLEALRLTCPCAECQGEHENMGKRVDDIRPVGNYAVQIFWGDGHNSGLYTWEHLRGICPCSTCQPGLKE